MRRAARAARPSSWLQQRRCAGAMQPTLRPWLTMRCGGQQSTSWRTPGAGEGQGPSVHATLAPWTACSSGRRWRPLTPGTRRRPRTDSNWTAAPGSAGVPKAKRAVPPTPQPLSSQLAEAMACRGGVLIVTVASSDRADLLLTWVGALDALDLQVRGPARTQGLAPYDHIAGSCTAARRPCC